MRNNLIRIAAAFAILAGIIFIPHPCQAQGVSLDSAETRLVLRDSDNAHFVAQAALNTVACIMQSFAPAADWTPEDCIGRLDAVLENYGQEHRLLHPRVEKMLLGKAEEKQS